MKRGKRRQRVVLRSKVRQERWSKAREFFMGKFSFLVIAATIAFGLHRFLFVSDFFMIKSLEVSAADPKITAEIKAKVSRFKGQSVLRVNLNRAEDDLKRQLPVLSTLTMRRSFPDRIKVSYSLRTAVALLKVTSQGRAEKVRALSQALETREDFPARALDAEGVVFPVSDIGGDSSGLPEIVVSTALARYRALGFIKAWNAAESEREDGNEKFSLHKITLDSWDEVSLYVRSASFQGETTRIVWGAYDAGSFAEKYSRLRDVWKDLVGKSMLVEYVNLRGVPLSIPSVLGQREVVGRVLIRPRTKVTQVLPKSNLKG